MKVFILTEGGKNIGFGHITRCRGLYDALKEIGITPLLVVNGDETCKHLLRNTNYLVIDWLKEKEFCFELIKGATGVIIDSYLTDEPFYLRVSRCCKIPIYFDDTKRLSYPRGIVVNGAPYAHMLRYPKCKDIKYLLGMRYVSLREEFWEVPQKTINRTIKNILITFGGMDHYALLNRIVATLKKNFNFTFIKAGTAETKVVVAKMKSLIHKADVCISGGGQTTFELARCGVPVIAICLADNQLFNLRGLSKLQCLEFAGHSSDINLIKKIKESVRKMTYQRRREMSNRGPRFVDGLGARKIAREIIN